MLQIGIIQGVNDVGACAHALTAIAGAPFTGTMCTTPKQRGRAQCGWLLAMGAVMEQPILSRHQYNMWVWEANILWAVSSFKVCLVHQLGPAQTGWGPLLADGATWKHSRKSYARPLWDQLKWHVWTHNLTNKASLWSPLCPAPPGRAPPSFRWTN